MERLAFVLALVAILCASILDVAVAGDILVGDMKLTQEQYDRLFGSDRGRHKRKAVEDLTLRWTDATVPYEFYGNDFSEYQKKDLRVAFDYYERETCLKFRPSTPEDVNKTVVRQGYGGCNSELGMVGGTQYVNLDNNGCRWFGLYLHEYGHAIGLVHEHQLPGRDEHIEVLWNNVAPDMRQWFKTYTEAELRRYGVPYDLSSVMHYELNAFSKMNIRAVRVKDPKKDDYIGRVYWKTLSFSDVKIVNKMYSCAAHCPTDIECPEEGFIDKHCKCQTPRAYFDRACVNIHGDDEKCNQWATEGECGSNPGWMNINCRRSCNACPRFGIDELIHREGDCYDQHIAPDLCEAWAAKGLCEEYPSTVKRWCRKTCNACDWEKGRCPNFGGDDSACDRWAKSGECDNNPLFMRAQCADSCGTCGWTPRGSCENKAGDTVCAEKKEAGECHKLDPWMMENCSASCDTCGFNAGGCDNKLDDAECLRRYLDGECQTQPMTMKKQCSKTCDTCGWGKKGACKNRFQDENSCDTWAAYGSCQVNPGWMGLFCASSCDTCDYPATVAEECFNSNGRDKDCEDWARAGECESNPEYMRMNCQKGCKTCSFTKPGACFDLHPEAQCQEWARAGECEANSIWMMKSCMKSCGKCDSTAVVPEETDAPEIPEETEEPDTGSPEETEEPEIPEETEEPDTEPPADCQDVYHDCAENAAKGWCETVSWMKDGCKVTCGFCDGYPDKEKEPDCRDQYHDCGQHAAMGWCETVPWMKDGCKASCGLCDGDTPVNTGNCRDTIADCPTWAGMGHCFVESVKMACPKSCNTC